jgi:hypothetical protein
VGPTIQLIQEQTEQSSVGVGYPQDCFASFSKNFLVMSNFSIIRMLSGFPPCRASLAEGVTSLQLLEPFSHCKWFDINLLGRVSKVKTALI